MKNLSHEKIYINIIVAAFILIVVILIYFDFRKDFHLDISEFNEKIFTSSDIEKIKQFEKNYGEPLFVSYFVYFKDGSLVNPKESNDVLRNYLLSENMATLTYLKGIFKDFDENDYGENYEITTVSGSTLLTGDKYTFDLESFGTLEVIGIFAEEDYYRVVLKSSSNIFYEFSNLAEIYDININDILFAKDPIGIVKGQAHMNMYILSNGEKEYINPYNFLILKKDF
ncbi:MAG: hypothetical protein ACK5LY_04930 [Lachnospirales bacterium]